MSVKISELPVLAPEDVAAGDVVAIVDESEGVTKRVDLSGVLSANAPTQLSQVQVEDPTSTVFGTVSGQRLAQHTDDAFNVTGDAPKYACRAWVNFDGTTTPPTIRASGNVSSVTRNGAGDYTVNFTTAMPDANYSISWIARRPDNENTVFGIKIGTSFLTTGVNVFSKNTAFGAFDSNICTLAVFR